MWRYCRWMTVALVCLLLGAYAPAVDAWTGTSPGFQGRPAMVSGGAARQPSRSYALAGQPGRVVVNRVVHVGGGGGSAQVRFSGRAGQRLYVSLRAANRQMEPYGHLEHARGAMYFPRNEQARPGFNFGVLDLRYTGRYTLTIFDGSNNGGLVRVVVSLVSPTGATAPPSTGAGRLLVNRTLDIPGGGGSKSVRFRVRAGQRVQITLRADTTRVQPYGHLSHSRSEFYFPLNSNAQPGYNQGVTVLRYGGSYTFTVFDGANYGGRVNVRVVALP